MPGKSTSGKHLPKHWRLPDGVLLRPAEWDPLPQLQAIRECRSHRVVVVVRKGTCEHASWLDESSPYLNATRALDSREYRFYRHREESQAALHGLATLQTAEAAAPAPPETSPSEAAVQTTWIEIAMVDDSGIPVADEEYRIEFPDGTVRTGRLNWMGAARLNGIPKGTCKVTFPRLDADAWEKA
jgi:hypothetical protein